VKVGFWESIGFRGRTGQTSTTNKEAEDIKKKMRAMKSVGRNNAGGGSSFIESYNQP
jgi:hypothetical protein